eukprot:228523-Pyramimonas_sp.AAC.1
MPVGEDPLAPFVAMPHGQLSEMFILRPSWVAKELHPKFPRLVIPLPNSVGLDETEVLGGLPLLGDVLPDLGTHARDITND